jgi:hypothetical protein
MLDLGANGRLQIQTSDTSSSHVYNIRAMVRVLGMAMDSEVDKEDRDLMKTYCQFLEAMLPDEGQVILSRPLLKESGQPTESKSSLNPS